MVAAGLHCLGLWKLVSDALGLIYGVDLQNLAHIAFLVQEFIPALQIAEEAVTVHSFIEFAFQEFKDGFL